MALRNIVMDGDPVLKKKCRPVTEFNDRLGQLLDDMGETMLENDGVGLAGPQVGVMRRVFVALDESSLPGHAQDEDDDSGDEGTAAGETGEDDLEEILEEEEWEPVILEFVNPEIIETKDEVQGYEGCLSFPGRFGAIRRPKWAKIRAFDRYGEPFEYEGTGLMARCLCHETDHLDGVTIDDLAEFFFDPEKPRDVDEQLFSGGEEDEAEAEATPAETAAE